MNFLPRCHRTTRIPTRAPSRAGAAAWAVWSAGVMLLLSGCPAQEEPASGSLTATVVACEVAEGASRCTLQVAWTSAGTGALQLRGPGDGPVIPALASGVADLATPVGGGTVLLIDDGVVLASLALSARCTDRAAPDAAGVCRPIPLTYGDKVYALYAGYPFAVGPVRAVPVTNRSRLVLAEQAADCHLAEAPAASGRIPVSCAVTSGGAGPWHRLYLDPTEDALFDDPDGSPVQPPASGPFGLPPIPSSLAAFVANGTYFDKGSGLLVGPYVTFGPRAGDPGHGFCSGSPACFMTVVPADYFDFLAESRANYYFRSSREGGLYAVPKDRAVPLAGTVPGLITKEGYQGFACRTCPSLSPSVMRVYSHPAQPDGS